MSKICGIDDAGKGPIIGPMIIAGVSLDVKDLHKLEKIGVKDSKKLTAKKRDELYPKILEIVKDYKIIIIPPQEIDNAVESDTTNLNWLEGEKMVEVINNLKADTSIVDCPSPNTVAFCEFLKSKIKIETELICTNKAERFLAVGAASIIAKVTRDAEVAKIQVKFKENIGSGYPADPYTKKFIAKHWKEDYGIFRKSWETYKELARKASQKTLLDV